MEDKPEELINTIPPTFDMELEALINKHSLENESGTPDWILAHAIRGFLNTWASAQQMRDGWYGHKSYIGNAETELTPTESTL